MDETDISLFKNKDKNKHKHDRADATCSTNTNQNSTEERVTQAATEKKIIYSRPTEEDEYNCDNPKAGIALIFNHKDVKGQKQRAGTEQDRDDMLRTLLNYGFDVRVFNDLTFAELSEQLKKSK